MSLPLAIALITSRSEKEITVEPRGDDPLKQQPPVGMIKPLALLRGRPSF